MNPRSYTYDTQLLRPYYVDTAESNYLILDELPDDTGLLVTIELDDGVLDFDFGRDWRDVNKAEKVFADAKEKIG